MSFLNSKPLRTYLVASADLPWDDLPCSELPCNELPCRDLPCSLPAGGQPKLCFIVALLRIILNELKLSTTDLLVLASKKNAAKCDK